MKATPINTSRWLVPIRRWDSPTRRVIGVPHAGGWPTSFMTWRESMPAGVDLFITQFPGRGGLLHEEPVASISELVDGMITALEPLLSLPYVLVGHSFGSVVCYELVRQLRQLGYPLPEKLIVSARQAPHIPSKPPFIHHKNDDDLALYLDRIGGIPSVVAQREELLSLILRTVRADFQALELYDYQPQMPLEISTTVIGAVDDPIVPQTVLASWGQHVVDAIDVAWMRGGHFYIYQQNNVQRLLQHILLPPMLQPARSQQLAIV